MTTKKSTAAPAAPTIAPTGEASSDIELRRGVACTAAHLPANLPKFDQATLVDESAPTELIICVRPYNDDRVDYIGTKAQLMAEGIVPADIEWPMGGRDCRQWAAGIVEYDLRHYKPAEAKGGRDKWIAANPDYWIVSGDSGRGLSWKDKLTKEYHADLKRWDDLCGDVGSAARQVQFKRAVKAGVDQRFQAVLASMLPPKKPRKPRGSAAEAN